MVKRYISNSNQFQRPNRVICNLVVSSSDINNTVNAIQPVGGAAPAGGVDHPSIEVESEGECFQDSIDTLSCTSDDTYVKSSDL